MNPLRIGILGAGPGGLYAAILLKLANPANHVTIIERNPAGATFGFGVVLSDKTMTHFRDADPKSFQEIMNQQASWNAIETFHRGVGIRSDGHEYSGIARKRLLDILQKRCEELGVILHFQTEMADLSRFDDCDLIIAADGINSTVRRATPEAFEPSLQPGQSKFIWLGIDQWIPTAFTFIFHETEHGLFQAHIYPFDKDKSTCIVMCRDATWKKAGLDKLDEAGSVAFVRDLMHPYLGDVRYLTNRSIWLTFQTVKAKNWYHGNVVLLGDAIHTAHWSIGSGTKLAMEDSITLVSALSRFADIPAALATYQAERKRVAEKIQRAAKVSELYCENAEQFLHLDPQQFTFQFMTRSGRIDYEDLRERDPKFIENLETWWADQTATKVPGFSEPAIAPALSPFKLRQVTLQNRMVSLQPPLRFALNEMPEPSYFEDLIKQARGLSGLVLTEVHAISEAAKLDPGSPAFCAPRHLDAWGKVLAAVHADTTTKIGLQLGHPNLRRTDLDQVQAEYCAAAALADEAGFDLLHLQMTESDLLGRFLIPDPELAQRLPTALQVLAAVRAVWPVAKPLGVSLSAGTGGETPLTEAQAAMIAEGLKAQGCDLIWVHTTEQDASVWPNLGGEPSIYTDQMTAGLQLASLVSGSIASPRQANTTVARGRADLCVIEP